MFRLFEFVLEAPEGDAVVQQIGQKIREGQERMVQNGFEKLVVEDFCETAVLTFERCQNKTYDADNL